MWEARTKNDLIIEVWEKLDCESVGAAEIEAIEVVLNEEFGAGAVDSPMDIARAVADEGADLRHAEIMELWIARATDRPYEAALRNVVDVSGLRAALNSLRALENLRKKYAAAGDREGVRLVRETSIRGKEVALETSARAQVDPTTRQVSKEISEWFSIWLQSAAAFESWIDLRLDSREFRDKFENIRPE